MQAFGSTQVERRNETVLKNINRIEPHAALFQIPPDYTIEERVMNGGVAPGLRPLGNNSTPNCQH
jgi:hypothetical protein